MSGDFIPVQIEVQRTKADYSSAVWLNYWRGSGFLVQATLALAVGAWGFFETVNEGLASAIGAGVVAAAFVYGVMLFITSSMAWGNMPHIVSAPGAMDPAEYVFSSKTIETKTRLGTSSVSWEVCKGWLENGRVILIRHHGNRFQVLPKRQIGPDVLVRLRSLLRSVFDRSPAQRRGVA